MMACDDEIERICGVLHDVVEDTDITLDSLRDMGFPEEVINVLGYLTKREGETYDDFIERILENETACRVKLADLADNMNLARIKNPTEKDKERIKKYEKATERILSKLQQNAK